MKEVEKLLKLGEDIKIAKTEEIGGEKIIYVESRKKKVRCPYCNKFTKSLHGHLKPMAIKDLKIIEKYIDNIFIHEDKSIEINFKEVINSI